MRTTRSPWLIVLALAALAVSSVVTEWQIAKLNAEEAHTLRVHPVVVDVPTLGEGTPSTS